ncbi:MAG: sigma-70 family RNA polymerase sigma factor [Acidobacteriota bacterium]
MREWAVKFERFLREHGFSTTDAYDVGFSCATHVLMQVRRFPGRPEGFESWVWKVARNFAEDHRRRQHGMRYVPIPVSMAAKTQTGASADSRSPLIQTAVSALEEVLSQLPAEDCRIIRMRYFEGSAGFREIAAALGIEEGAVRVLHHRILNKIRDLLADDSRIQALL